MSQPGFSWICFMIGEKTQREQTHCCQCHCVLVQDAGMQTTAKRRRKYISSALDCTSIAHAHHSSRLPHDYRPPLRSKRTRRNVLLGATAPVGCRAGPNRTVVTMHVPTSHLFRCIQDFFFYQFLNYKSLEPLSFSAWRPPRGGCSPSASWSTACRLGPMCL